MTAPTDQATAAAGRPRFATRERGWLPLVLPLALVGGYAIAASRAENPYFPPPSRILTAARALWIGPGFGENVLPSLMNLAVGYLVGLVFGVLAGVLVAELPILRGIVDPLISLALALPPVALLPLFLILFGVGDGMQRAMITFAVLVIVTVNTATGIRGVDAVQRDLSAVTGLGVLRRLSCLLLPSAAPNILAGARVALATGMLVMVVGEMIGAARGIGASIMLAQQEFNYDRMWAGMLLLAVLGVAANLGFSWLERLIAVRLGLIQALTEDKS